MSNESDNSGDRETRRLIVGGAIAALILAIGVTAWPFLTQDQLGTPKDGANPAAASDDTQSRGAPAQSAAESDVGKNDPAGNEDPTGGRARAIKQTSRPLELSQEQHSQLSNVISQQRDPPQVQQSSFEMMIGSAVPKQVELKDIPPEVTKIMNGFWGDQYVLVQGRLVIVDQHSRRVVAIVPISSR